MEIVVPGRTGATEGCPELYPEHLPKGCRTGTGRVVHPRCLFVFMGRVPERDCGVLIIKGFNPFAPSPDTKFS